MNLKRRLLAYILIYKYRILFGILFSLIVSILNGISITGLIPIFDSLGNKKNYQFKITLTKKDISLLQKSSKNLSLSKLDRLFLKIAKLKKIANQKLKDLSQSRIVFLFCIFIFPVYLFKLIFLACVTYLINSAGLLVTRDLRNELYQKVQNLPLSFFIKEKSGNIMSRILNDVEIISQLISKDLKDAITDFFYIITHLLLILFLNWKLFLCVILILPLVMGPIGMFTNKIKKMTLNVQNTLSFLTEHLQEVFSGIRVIRGFSTEKQELNRFLQLSSSLSDKNFKNHFYHQIGPSITEFASFVIIIIFLSFSIYLIQFENMTPGIFMAFLATLIFLMRPFKQIGNLINSLNSTIAASKRVFEILDLPILENKGASSNFYRLEKGIFFHNVSFCHNVERKIIKDLSFSIPAKKTVSFVGASGSGKSTIIDLISNLIKPNEGNIFFDNHNLQDLKIQHLRKKIGVVSQYHFLFNDTIEKNICYGCENITEKDIWKVIEQSSLIDFIKLQSNGLKTIVGEEGVMLSGGQIQKISIARILLSNPEILIFDEATSSLDNESEKIIQTMLQKLYKEKTIIIAAHKLNTVKFSDIIYYIEDGKIEETGNHNELIKRNSKYKDFYTIQVENI